MIPAEIDENMLQQIASITDGKYYRATNNRALEEVYKDIDKLEKTKIEVTSYRNAKELFFPWLSVGLMLLFLEVGLSQTIFKGMP
jgi:Ca-activated chloride channel family protein